MSDLSLFHVRAEWVLVGGVHPSSMVLCCCCVRHPPSASCCAKLATWNHACCMSCLYITTIHGTCPDAQQGVEIPCALVRSNLHLYIPNLKSSLIMPVFDAML
jgi:hypothetical protein